MENQNIENKNEDIKKEENNNEDNKNLKNNENNNSTVKEVNNINNEKSKNNKENIEKEKIKIDDLIKKDKKLKEIYTLINSTNNSNEQFIISNSKDKINNFLNGSFSKDSKNIKSDSKNKNLEKYKEIYEQINKLDSFNEKKKNKQLIPYSQYKSHSSKKNNIPIKQNKEIKTIKQFSSKKNDDIFSDLEKPKKYEWMSNNLFKSKNIFNFKSQKDFYDTANNTSNQLIFGKDDNKLNNYYKTELSNFGEMLKKGNSVNSISGTPKKQGSFLQNDYTNKFEKNNLLEKLNKW